MNSLPIFIDKPDMATFRNPNGVSLKLSNFLSLDSSYKGKGMDRRSELDKIVFNEFKDNRRQLHEIASEIKKVIGDEGLKTQLYYVEEDEQTSQDSVSEGQVLYKLHKVRERDKKIVRQKKEQALSRFGRLACESCVFVFAEYYGAIGGNYIECHHRTPLSDFKVATKTTLDDLALVCSNCHRMLHKNIDTLTIDELKTMITYQKEIR